MHIIDKATYERLYKEKRLFGRYINHDQLSPSLDDLNNYLFKHVVSENGEPIKLYKLGTGAKKILIWSQMHGNETTGTKALIDYVKFLFTSVTLLDYATFYILPMLNPDGSRLFTRVNYKNVDLNRDAVDYQSKELKFLKSILDEVNPDYCFNLHDQRNIFNPRGSKMPATLSFLAPSEDQSRSITESRKTTMEVIAFMYQNLESLLPDGIGRYTDEFYPTATGDNFQKLGYPTILIEAGHFKGDLVREQSRYYNFLALYLGVNFILDDDIKSDYETYFEIPENDNICFDLIERGVRIGPNDFTDIGYLYSFHIEGEKAIPFLKEEKRGDLGKFISFKELS
ncbi:M14 family zinc carboxypeptidase [Flavobacteriaceae bacterium]|nr:M14 family zinc carboxypeptidase [Flavobacteriaceae bacterium]